MPPFPQDVNAVDEFDKAVVVTEPTHPFKIVHVNQVKETHGLYSHHLPNKSAHIIGS